MLCAMYVYACMHACMLRGEHKEGQEKGAEADGGKVNIPGSCPTRPLRVATSSLSWSLSTPSLSLKRTVRIVSSWCCCGRPSYLVRM